MTPLDATPPSVTLVATGGGVTGVLLFGVLLPPPPQAAKVEVRAQATLMRDNFMRANKMFYLIDNDNIIKFQQESWHNLSQRLAGLVGPAPD
jgi:hypothetical protein